PAVMSTSRMPAATIPRVRDRLPGARRPAGDGSPARSPDSVSATEAAAREGRSCSTMVAMPLSSRFDGNSMKIRDQPGRPCQVHPRNGRGEPRIDLRVAGVYQCRLGFDDFDVTGHATGE